MPYSAISKWAVIKVKCHFCASALAVCARCTRLQWQFATWLSIDSLTIILRTSNEASAIKSFTMSKVFKFKYYWSLTVVWRSHTSFYRLPPTNNYHTSRDINAFTLPGAKCANVFGELQHFHIFCEVVIVLCSSDEIPRTICQVLISARLATGLQSLAVRRKSAFVDGAGPAGNCGWHY